MADDFNLNNKSISKAKCHASSLILAAKHEVVDKGFQQAIAKLCNMTDNLYRELIEEIIKKHAENNEYVVIASRDARRLTSEWLDKVCSRINIRLVLSDEFHEQGGGIILSGKDYDKILTFKAAAKQLKQELGHNLFDKIIQL